MRTKTKQIKVGNVLIGGNNKVIIQSMTNTKTKNVSDTVNQINKLICPIKRLISIFIFFIEMSFSPIF